MFKSTMTAIAAVCFTIVGLAAVSPAAAQTGPAQIEVASNGSCPTGYSRGSSVGLRKTNTNSDFCYGNTSTPPLAAKKRSVSDPCPSGMRSESSTSYWCTTAPAARTWSAETNLAKGGKLTKPSLEARCPTGWASNSDLRTCYTTLENPPATRLSNGKPCAAGEMEEWGTWCTGSIKAVTYAHADGHGAADFNRVYLHRQLNGGDWQSMKCCLSPAAAAYYKSIGAGPAPVGNATAPKDDSTSAEEDEARGMAIARGMTGGNPGQAAQPQCDTGSAAGAAVGAAIGGSTGARIGSMLGGFSKKKKTGC